MSDSTRSRAMLETARLSIQPIAADDADMLLEVFRAPAVRRYLLDDTLVSRDWVCDEIATSHSRFTTGGAGLCAIRLRGAPAIIGFVGFREFFDPPRLQLLYGLLPEYWGQGLALEAAARMCEWAFDELGLPRVEAEMDAPNTGSIALAERLGFMRAVEGASPTSVRYEMQRDTWRERGGARGAVEG